MADGRVFSGDLADSGFFGSEGGDGAEALDLVVIDLVDELSAQAPPGREGLIRVLLGLQNAFARVSWRVQELVADRFGLSPAQVAGVVSYYPMLSAQRQSRIEVHVCTGSGCFLLGGDRAIRQVAEAVSGRESSTEEPGRVIRQERCLGVCGLGPVVRADGRIRSILGQSEINTFFDSLLGPKTDGEDHS